MDDLDSVIQEICLTTDSGIDLKKRTTRDGVKDVPRNPGPSVLK